MYFFFLYYNKVEDIFIYIEKLYSSGFLVVVWFFFKINRKVYLKFLMFYLVCLVERNEMFVFCGEFFLI